ncbi:MAG: exodeoxyribonuclease VII small subunit [Taibaiella sp.]|nr:exodeoxyribonuclease VII small subunit [Taibaiella sp.]
MEQIQSYETAFAELQEIEAAIMAEDVTIDELAGKVRRAAELIAYCRTRLRTATDEVNGIVKEIGEEG